MTHHTARSLLPAVAALSLLLSGCSDESPATEPGTTSPSTGAPSGTTPVSLKDYEGAIDPGRHRVPLISWERTYPVDALVDVPEGFVTPGGWVVENGESGTAYGDLMFFGDVDRVDTDPCAASGLVKPGPTVRDLAFALSSQGQQWTTAPKAVTVGGRRGLYIETRPRDPSRCAGGQFTLWQVNATDPFTYAADQPGSVIRVWILDVDGLRVAMAVKVVPGSTTHAAELVHMAKTARFVRHGVH